MGLALLDRLRETPLALQVNLRPAESMAEERPLQSDAGPLTPSLHPNIAPELGHGDTALEACIVEGTPGANSGNAGITLFSPSATHRTPAEMRRGATPRAGQSHAMKAAQESRRAGQTILFWLTIANDIAAARISAPAYRSARCTEASAKSAKGTMSAANVLDTPTPGQ